MNSNKKEQYVDSAGFIHYMPENTAVPIQEAAEVYNKNKRDIWKEAERLLKEVETPKPEPEPEPKKDGTVKELSRLLKDVANY